MASKAPAAKRETLNLRVKSEDRSIIDRAAQLLGKSRTDFLVDAGRRAAENALLDQTLFKVSPKTYKEFLARLDAPPKPNPQLLSTMKTSPPWT